MNCYYGVDFGTVAVVNNQAIREAAVFEEDVQVFSFRFEIGNAASPRLFQVIRYFVARERCPGFFINHAQQAQGSEDQQKSQYDDNCFYQFELIHRYLACKFCF